MQECGAHELTVTHIWNIEAGTESDRWRAWGALKDNHLWQYEFNETGTHRSGGGSSINCGNCDREIEFGWSQRERGGLILPVVFSDFDPLESWPDLKFVGAWRKNGWLRTNPSFNAHRVVSRPLAL
jgi:hypothetical protein